MSARIPSIQQAVLTQLTLLAATLAVSVFVLAWSFHRLSESSEQISYASEASRDLERLLLDNELMRERAEREGATLSYAFFQIGSDHPETREFRAFTKHWKLHRGTHQRFEQIREEYRGAEVIATQLLFELQERVAQFRVGYPELYTRDLLPMSRVWEEMLALARERSDIWAPGERVAKLQVLENNQEYCLFLAQAVWANAGEDALGAMRDQWTHYNNQVYAMVHHDDEAHMLRQRMQKEGKALVAHLDEARDQLKQTQAGDRKATLAFMIVLLGLLAFPLTKLSGYAWHAWSTPGPAKKTIGEIHGLVREIQGLLQRQGKGNAREIQQELDKDIHTMEELVSELEEESSEAAKRG